MKNKFMRLIAGKKAGPPDTREFTPAFAYAGLSDKGLRRSVNEDSFGIFPEEYLPPFGPGGQLFLVADGMGGLLSGRMASEMAVNIVQDVYFNSTEGLVGQNLKRALAEANSRIFQKAIDQDLDHKMGTTCSALVLTDDRGTISHVGDSRIYHIHQGEIRQLTEDHTEIADLLRHDLLTSSAAANHPRRSVLSRALGIEEDVDVDLLYEIPLHKDDRFVLCTDGLSKVSPDEIKDATLNHTPKDACRALIEIAYERGAGDNITVMVVQISL
jgi:serine/threonine protein phosphatase PrpC